MLSRARLDWRCSSHLKKITSPGMRARRGVHVGREKSWAVVEISPARHQSTADQRCCGDGELQRSEADVDNFNYEPAILTYSRIKNGCAIRSIYRLHCYSGRVHQYQLDRNTQTRLSDKSKSPVRLLTSSNCCLSVWPKPCWAGSLSFLLPQAAKVTSRSI